MNANLLIRDRLDDRLGLGLLANQVGAFSAFRSRIGHTVQAFIDLPRHDLGLDDLAHIDAQRHRTNSTLRMRLNGSDRARFLSQVSNRQTERSGVRLIPVSGDAIDREADCVPPRDQGYHARLSTSMRKVRRADGARPHRTYRPARPRSAHLRVHPLLHRTHQDDAIHVQQRAATGWIGYQGFKRYCGGRQSSDQSAASYTQSGSDRPTRMPRLFRGSRSPTSKTARASCCE